MCLGWARPLTLLGATVPRQPENLLQSELCENPKGSFPGERFIERSLKRRLSYSHSDTLMLFRPLSNVKTSILAIQDSGQGAAVMTIWESQYVSTD